MISWRAVDTSTPTCNNDCINITIHQIFQVTKRQKRCCLKPRWSCSSRGSGTYTSITSRDTCNWIVNCRSRPYNVSWESLAGGCSSVARIRCTLFTNVILSYYVRMFELNLNYICICFIYTHVWHTLLIEYYEEQKR